MFLWWVNNLPSYCSHNRILNTTLLESWEIVGPYPSWWVFNLLLVLLQLLHCFWSYLIVKTACRAISKGRVSHSTLSCFHSYLFLPHNVKCFPAVHSKMTDFHFLSSLFSSASFKVGKWNPLHVSILQTRLFCQCGLMACFPTFSISTACFMLFFFKPFCEF